MVYGKIKIYVISSSYINLTSKIIYYVLVLGVVYFDQQTLAVHNLFAGWNDFSAFSPCFDHFCIFFGKRGKNCDKKLLNASSKSCAGLAPCEENKTGVPIPDL